MDQRKNASVQPKTLNRNKRLSDVMMEDLSLEDQNNPPGSSKRIRLEDTIPENKEPDLCDKAEDELVTPAAVPATSESPAVPASAAPSNGQKAEQDANDKDGNNLSSKEESAENKDSNDKDGNNLPSEEESAEKTLEEIPNLADSCEGLVVQYMQQVEEKGSRDINCEEISASHAALSEQSDLAPRILLVNQQVNALAEGLNRLGPSAIFHQILRTPPSAKTSKVYLKQKSSEEYRGFDPFDRVSDEIILRIFHHLPRHTMCTCALVCRRWARIVCDISLWRRMDFAGRPLKVGILKILLERGVEVLRLNRSEVMGDFSSTVHGSPDPKRSPLSEDRYSQEKRKSLERFKLLSMYRLQMVDMSMCNVKTSLVESMVKFCPYLRKISLENIPVTEQLLINLGFTSPYLDTVNLAMCQGVTSKGLKSIIENCSSLSHLNIAWTYMSRQDIQSVIHSMPQQLLSLDISGNREKITDEDIEILCQQSPQLRDLELSDSTEITNVTIDTIADSLSNLRRISLSRCYSITPQALVNLTRIRSLTTINVFGMMRDSSLTALEGYLRRYKINREPFSTVARPTPSNEKVVKMWNVIARSGPVV